MRKPAYFLLTVMVVCTAFTGCKRDGADGNASSVDSIPMLIMQIQKCSRLYTTEYRVHKIVTYDDVVQLRGKMFSKDYSMNLPLGDRKVAIPMDATLKAYIDFSGFSEKNVSKQEDGKISIILPDPRVVMTDSKIDQNGVREYVALTRSHFSDRELSTYEQQGREAIIASIPQMGIIETARESAARLLVPIIASMGYEEQNVTIAFSREFDAGDIRSLLDINNVER